MMISTCIRHQAMLQDEVRVSAWRQAILETVRPGDVVVDLGSGSGLLGFFACQAGARRVYAIEQDDIIECARQLAAANGFQDRMVFIQGNSANTTLPERADVIVSDILGHFCLDMKVTQAVGDARERFLKPGGSLVPARAEMFLAPVEAFDAYEERVAFWNRPIGGIDYGLVGTAATNRCYALLIPPEGLLAAPVCIEDLDFYVVGGEVALDREVTFVVERPGTLHGLTGCFEAQLSPNVRLSTGPASRPTVWKQTFFSIAEPVPVVEGDAVRTRVTAIDAGSIVWEWQVEVIGVDGASKGRFKHSNYNPPRKDLMWHMPDFRPELSEDGRIARFVLDGCDGQATLGEIASRLRRQFPERCPTEKAARRWVRASLRGRVEMVEKLSDLLPFEIQGAADSDTLVRIPSHHSEVTSWAIDDEILVFKLDSGQVTVLNGVGGKVWELMDGAKSVNEIVGECAEFYQVDRGRVKEDVLVFVGQLLEQEMIVFDESVIKFTARV